ncbi:MAG: alpha/beta hydrolase [Saprospiraceae bacterium]|nr:alpha/beta hydrolase [Candidatus Vicinibacter affinis]MBK7305377.1 alpha/beta hydrolase [Candidatus Vicinibacter affinis]MBK7799601.1 alpha/beta hydrolase [Candidatus Vicinibacter affinis]MBK8643866.1 alpha/beta hydrolase [Candidatus Vicinibacter affinis]MBP6172192.1 alpha/beta hydrolase [Saprospiraceae bacterium]
MTLKLILLSATLFFSSSKDKADKIIVGNPCSNDHPFGSTVTCTCYEEDYGNNLARQKYDLYLPDGFTNRPIVIYIHGGGFTGGHKRKFMNPANNIAQVAAFLDAGYAVASLEYRLLNTSNETVGLRKCIQDCKDAIADIRNLPSSYGIDPDRIALWGSSAGAGIAMLIAFEDNTVNRPYKAVWVDIPQATYDINKWQGGLGVFPDCNLTNIISILTPTKVKSIYGLGTATISNIPAFLSMTQSYRAEVDIIQYIDNTDPPVWIENKAAQNNQTLGNCPSSKDVLNHHKNHCLKLKNKLAAQNVEWHLRLKDVASNTIVTIHSQGAGNWNSGVEFVKDKLN